MILYIIYDISYIYIYIHVIHIIYIYMYTYTHGCESKLCLDRSAVLPMSAT